MERRPDDIESTGGELPRFGQFGAIFGLLVCLGLVFVSSLEALAPLCGGKRATISSNDRVIQGTPAPDTIAGGPGPNVIHGAGGSDTICGGHGRDRIYGERGNDTIDGKGDRDEVDGGPGDDEVAGGRGSLDTVLGGIGNDRIDGGPGKHDIASYRSAGGAVEVDLRHGAVAGAEEERLVRIEDVLGGSGEDTLVGSGATPNRLDGGPGNDVLHGARRSDQAFGGPGSDMCFGSFAVEDSCGPSSGRGRGTKVELYESITASVSIAIAGDDQVDEVTVSRGGSGYLVRRGSDSPVLLGGPVSSILVSLGAGGDTLTVEDSVPAKVAVTVDGGPGSDWLRGGLGDDTLYAGDDGDPDTLTGDGGDDALFGVNILHPRLSSGAATMVGGAGDDLLIGGQPCNDLFHGGGGDNDSASFARVRNPGTVVRAAIGGRVVDPDVGYCGGSRIDGSVEKIEGSTGPDVLIGSAGAETLLGRGGADLLDAMGGPDRCIGGRGSDRARHCEYVR